MFLCQRSTIVELSVCLSSIPCPVIFQYNCGHISFFLLVCVFAEHAQTWLVVSLNLVALYRCVSKNYIWTKQIFSRVLLPGYTERNIINLSPNSLTTLHNSKTLIFSKDIKRKMTTSHVIKTRNRTWWVWIFFLSCCGKQTANNKTTSFKSPLCLRKKITNWQTFSSFFQNKCTKSIFAKLLRVEKSFLIKKFGEKKEIFQKTINKIKQK